MSSLNKKLEMPYQQEELKAILALGILFFETGQWRKARIVFEGLLAITPLDLIPALMIGEIFLCSGKAGQAIQHFKKCLGQQGNFELLLGLSRAYLLANQFDKARLCLAEILENSRQTSEVIVERAQVLLDDLQRHGAL